MTIEPHVQMLLSLLKSALWNTAPDEKLFVHTEETVWKKIMDLSMKQGVKAIALDGAMKLPKELQPPRNLRLAWAAFVDKVERNYAYRVSIAKELSELFAKNGMKMLLFKGLSLSQHYPVPEHREFGDLDIYLFGKHDEGNKLLVENGAKRENFNIPKHTVLHYKNVMIENHIFFLDMADTPKIQVLENKLRKLAVSDENQALLFPKPAFLTLFLMCHAIRHFTYTTHFRSFCDWAVFLNAHQGKLDFSSYRQDLSEAGFLKVADAFTALTVKYFGLNPEFAPPFENNFELEDEIFINGIFSMMPVNPAQPFYKKLIFKAYRFKRRLKYYEMLYPGKTYRRIWYAIYYHLRKPKEILSLKK